MQKQTSFDGNFNPITEAAFVASRQVWLASLGVAAVTREWARTEAGKTFRSLVKEGSATEAQAIRAFGKGMETSIANATSLWKQARRTAMTTASSIADTAASALSKVKAPILKRNAPTKARKAVKATKKRVVRATRGAKRSTKRNSSKA